MAKRENLSFGRHGRVVISADRAESMGRDSIWKLLFRFSGPAIAASVVSASYNLVDAIFIGRLGTEALAGLAVASPLMAIYRAIGIGTGIGASSLIARRLGAGKKDEANRTAGSSIGLFLLVSAAVTVICLLNLKTFLGLFGADDEVMPAAYSYMVVETVFIFVDFFLLVLIELVRVEGNPVLASSAMIISGIMNCIWDPILMFGIGPFPAMGMAGAAIATTIGRTISVAILLIYLASGKTTYRFKPSYFLPNWRIAVEIYRVGISMMIRMGAGSFSHVIANRAVAPYGVTQLATLGVLFRASSFAFQPCMGIGQGVLPLVGYNYGAKKKDRVGEAITKAALVGFAWGVLCWITAMLFATQIMELFNTDPEFLAIATPAYRVYALGFFTVGTQTILGFFFQGIGRGLPSLIVASSRQLIFMIPALLIMPWLFGLNGVWAAYPVADTMAIVLTLIWITVEFKKQGMPFRLRFNQVAAAEPKKVLG